MSFLKRILRKINKSSESKGFNLKKFNALTKEELPENLTALDEFQPTPTAAPQIEGPVRPNVNEDDIMRAYISQNYGAFPMSPMDDSWVESSLTHSKFIAIANEVLGPNAEAFISQALQSTEISKETPTTIEGDWQSLGGFSSDLVASYSGSSNYQENLNQVANSIKGSSFFPQVQDDSTSQLIAHEAVKVALASPEQRGKPGAFDQRFNFFLSSSGFKYLDPQVADAVIEIEGTPNKLNFLKENYGDILIEKMNELAELGDRDITAWVLKSTGKLDKGTVQQIVDQSLTGGDEGSRGTDIQDMDIEKMNRSRVEQREQDFEYVKSQTDEVSRAAAAFMKEYIGNIKSDMKEAVAMSLEDAYNIYGPQKGDSSIERISIYLKQLLGQYDKIFNDNTIIPRPDSEGNVIFSNQGGSITIPKEYLSNVFQGDISKPAEQLYKDIQAYSESGGGGADILEWFKKNDKGIVTYESLSKAYEEVYDLKKNILSQLSRNQSPDIIIEALGGDRDILDKYANVVNGIGTDEIRKRRHRFIERTRQQSQVSDEASVNHLKNMQEIALEKKRQDKKGIGSKEESIRNTGKYRSLRANVQWDIDKLMAPLARIQETQKNSFEEPFKADVFKALIGALNPHVKVREGNNKKYYNKLIGIESQDDIKIEGVDSRIISQLEKMTNSYNGILRAKAMKQKALDKLEDTYKKQYQSYNNKIINKLDAENKKRQKTKTPSILPEEYVGMEGWTGDTPLPPNVYARLAFEKKVGIGKAEEVLTKVLGKMELIKNREPKKGGLKTDIRDFGLNAVSERLEVAKKELDEFKRQNGLTGSQVSLAMSAYNRYMEKISAIQNIQKRAITIKMSSRTILYNEVEKNIKKEYEDTLRHIFMFS